MNVIGLCLCLIFVGSARANQDPLVVERATEEEARQVQEVSDAFERRMRETRDVGLLKDLFLDDFMRLRIKSIYPNGQVSLFESIPLSLRGDLATQVTQRDWERFYAAQLNLRYYLILLVVSRVKPDDLKEPNNSLIRKLYPTEVLTLLQRNPFIKGEYGLEHDHTKHLVETLDDFQSLVTTLDRAALMLRQHFLKHPPEETGIYKENFRRASKEQRTRKEGLLWPHLYGTEESRLGFPKGTRFFHRITADSMFELSFVKTEQGVKIVWARVYPFN
ncbi:MAG TPA: hypothetical protein VFR80_01400 [Pyrinomonadaceae bacterium]|nr:hypothetical protein [Pyrinomonadaceae bacterium]